MPEKMEIFWTAKLHNIIDFTQIKLVPVEV